MNSRRRPPSLSAALLCAAALFLLGCSSVPGAEACRRQQMQGASHATTEAQLLSRRALGAKLAGALTWHKGLVLTDPVKVFMVYVGYTEEDTEPQKLNFLVKHFEQSSWWKVMTKYYRVVNGKNVYISGKISLGGALYVDIDTMVNNGYADLSGDTAIPDFLANIGQVDGFTLPQVKNAIYVLVPKKDDQLTFPKEFCSQMCAWHNFQDVTYQDGSTFRLFYSFVPAQDSCSSCTGDILKAVGGDETASPMGSNNLDAMVDSLVHELAETVTDPLTEGGWYDDGVSDQSQNENGDVCASKYGKVKTMTVTDADGNENQVYYNQIVGGEPYLFQTIWNPAVNPKTKKQYGCVAGV